MEVQTDPLLRTVARRIYTKKLSGAADPFTLPVYLLENGKLLNAATLEEWEPDESWFHAESYMEPATYVLMLKWSDRWGEECVALFGSATDADGFVRRMGLGTHIRQRVRLIL